ncbi:hypothetical protein Y032_0001g439 [Ancylostoma ceylanicum]|uniref:Uncharacterized protein n=1 Tax=Ancylostoma ceylanicum TaxID=53326 RepID=A0A016W4H6_9BILA|nr:hypothetical protein Y032_0001g439 [Ancylostoma ceylanicum]
MRISRSWEDCTVSPSSLIIYSYRMGESGRCTVYFLLSSLNEFGVRFVQAAREKLSLSLALYETVVVMKLVSNWT